MKIDELIEKLENFKKEYGNLEIGICRANQRAIMNIIQI